MLGRALIVAAGAAFPVSTAFAQVWTGPGGTAAVPTTGLWNVNANWVGGVAPVSGVDTALTFGQTAGGPYTATNDFPGFFDLNRMTLHNTAGGQVANGTTITSAVGSWLRFRQSPAPVGPPAPATITKTGFRDMTLSSPFDVPEGLRVTQNGSGRLWFMPRVNGAGTDHIELTSLLDVTGGGSGAVNFGGAGIGEDIEITGIAGSMLINGDYNAATGIGLNVGMAGKNTFGGV
jgi:hypothetical protein